jgi:hypothetical protein
MDISIVIPLQMKDSTPTGRQIVSVIEGCGERFAKPSSSTTAAPMRPSSCRRLSNAQHDMRIVQHAVNRVWAQRCTGFANAAGV